MKLVLCSSAAFYQHVVTLATELEANAMDVVIPVTARKMRDTGNFDVSTYKTWYENPDDYTKKANLMRLHFDEISGGDAILVVNDEKHGIKDYIGPNVLLEMSLAWYQKKPIYILNNIPVDSPFEEEIKGMAPVVLNGDVSKLR